MTASQSGPVGAAPSASVLVTIEGAVATLVLNRPDRLNALDLPLWRALGEAVAVLAGRLAEGEDLRCLVLRGAGGGPSPPAPISANSPPCAPPPPRRKTMIG